MYYRDIFERLNQERVQYVVAGGIALVLHGVVRLTADLDIIVDLSPDNVQRFIAAMEGLGYRPKIPVKAMEFASSEKREEWVEKKGMKVFTFYHPLKSEALIDVFVKEPMPFADLDREKKEVVAGGVAIPIASIRHLKEMKRAAGRTQDLADVESLNNLEEILRENP
jgi:hypothetical protein